MRVSNERGTCGQMDAGRQAGRLSSSNNSSSSSSSSGGGGGGSGGGSGISVSITSSASASASRCAPAPAPFAAPASRCAPAATTTATQLSRSYKNATATATIPGITHFAMSKLLDVALQQQQVALPVVQPFHVPGGCWQGRLPATATTITSIAAQRKRKGIKCASWIADSG
jgi:hypothetical protein